MPPEDGALIDAFNEAFLAIDLLCERQMVQSALVLIYSTIDAAAWLDVPAGDVTREDFIRWVDTHLLPGTPILATALELYAARCGILHSLTAFSRLSREGRVRTVGYARGTASVEDLNQMAWILRRDDIVGVHVDHLRQALKAGMQHFLDDAAKDRDRWARVSARAKSLFSHLPQVVMEDAVAKATRIAPR